MVVVVRNVSICVGDIFCFIAVFSEMPVSAVVRAQGLGSSPSLSTSCLSTWAHIAPNLVTTAQYEV